MNRRPTTRRGTKATVASLIFGLGTLALASSASAIEVAAVDKLVNNGSSSRRYDIVIVGDGYTRADMPDYQRVVQLCVDELKHTSPYSEYWRYLNITRLDVVSKQSGTRHKDDPKKDTAFGASHGHSGRYLRADRTDINRLVAKYANDAQVIVCFVNGAYGGTSFGKVCFVGHDHSMPYYVPQTFVHELGHSVGRLADEYSTLDHQVPSWVLKTAECLGRPILELLGWGFDNVTAQTKLKRIPWRHWLEAGVPLPTTFESGWTGVGLWEGALHLKSDMYRPRFSCLMATGYQFCEVCREVHVLALSEHVKPYTWHKDIGKTSTRLSFKTIVPGPVRSKWYVGRKLVAENVSALDLGRKDVSGWGGSWVRVEVQDFTSYVRKDSKQVLVHTHEWLVSRKGDGTKVKWERVRGTRRTNTGPRHHRSSRQELERLYGRWQDLRPVPRWAAWQTLPVKDNPIEVKPLEPLKDASSAGASGTLEKGLSKDK